VFSVNTSSLCASTQLLGDFCLCDYMAASPNPATVQIFCASTVEFIYNVIKGTT